MLCVLYIISYVCIYNYVYIYIYITIFIYIYIIIVIIIIMIIIVIYIYMPFVFKAIKAIPITYYRRDVEHRNTHLVPGGV